MPDFITLLRDIRDRMYVDMQSWYETVIAITVGSTTNIDPVNGTVQPATVTYDPNANEFNFGIPTSATIEAVTATNIPAISGVVQPATVEMDYETNTLSLGIPINDVIDNTDASLLRADGTVELNAGYIPTSPLDIMTKEGTGTMDLVWTNGDTPDPQQVPWIYGDGLFLVQFSDSQERITIPIFDSIALPSTYTPYVRHGVNEHYRAGLNADKLKALLSTDNGANDSAFVTNGFNRIWKLRGLVEA